MGRFFWWALFVALVPSSLRGATVSFSHTEVGLPSGSMGTFMVPQYADPGGMPLIGVTLHVDGSSAGGTNTFDNEAPVAGTATVVIGSAIDVDGPLPIVGGRLIANVDPVNTNTGPVVADSEGGPPDFVGGDSISVSGTGATDSDTDSTILATEMLPYLGGGMVTFNYDTLTNTAGSFSTTGGGANSVAFAAIRSSFTATITYEFIPEPATWVMLLAAVAGLAAIGFRRGMGRRAR